ncbi:MAG: hypothetical protein A2V90_09240 [Gammaproteobacteria bacterium RBG_16_57_12]|nr:MAG: hypothetical protein A2V90_09240 [Gammaproteobacteria bacterium RBG_16_57_12]
MRITEKLTQVFSHWLAHEDEPRERFLCDFDRLSAEIRPCDILLVEGRSRISHVIKTITQSIWTHAGLYIGRLNDIEDAELRNHIRNHYDGNPDDQLVIEALLGKGTIIAPLHKYRLDNLRICRPNGLSREDAQHIIRYSAYHLGMEYDLRQLIDLARFFFPYGILPRRWRSTLFEHHAGKITRTVCSTMIASAFSSVHYPVVPFIHREPGGQLRFHKRNARLYRPSDFDFSPYFDIVKYPLLGLDDISLYRQLPWDAEGLVCNGPDDCYVPPEQPAPPAGPPQQNSGGDGNMQSEANEHSFKPTLTRQPKT